MPQVVLGMDAVHQLLCTADDVSSGWFSGSSSHIYQGKHIVNVSRHAEHVVLRVGRDFSKLGALAPARIPTRPCFHIIPYLPWLRRLTNLFLTVVNGSYDVIQSQFAQPCIPASDFTPGFNGFNSGVRPTTNGTAPTFLNITIADNSTAIWFFENSTCSDGGVGVINANDSSTETLDGFSVSS